MSQEPEDDDLKPEYDFSGAVRGKYYQRYQQGTNVILLDPDVAQAFKDSASVNRALRLLLDLAKQEVSQVVDPAPQPSTRGEGLHRPGDARSGLAVGRLVFAP
jgi:hypothetical protein